MWKFLNEDIFLDGAFETAMLQIASGKQIYIIQVSHFNSQGLDSQAIQPAEKQIT
jgi:hypothetical protein